MAQTVEQLLGAEIGNLVLQLSIKEHQLQTLREQVAKHEAAVEAAKPAKAVVENKK
jgi:hypothetical protein